MTTVYRNASMAVLTRSITMRMVMSRWNVGQMMGLLIVSTDPPRFTITGMVSYQLSCIHRMVIFTALEDPPRFGTILAANFTRKFTISTETDIELMDYRV